MVFNYDINHMFLLGVPQARPQCFLENPFVEIG